MDAAAEKATSVRRALGLLFALADDEALVAGGLGVKRLAQLLEDDKSRVSRTLRTLQEYGLVQRDPVTLTYRLGWSVYTLARRAGNAQLLTAAAPRVEALMDEFKESAHLSVLSGAEVLTVVSSPSPRAVSAAGSVGRLIAAYCTASGRALLLDEDLPALARVLGRRTFPAAGPNAPLEVGELHRRIVAARVLGYSTVVEESEPGLVAAGAPVRDHRGQIVAALNVSAPAFRFAQRLTEAGRRIRDVAFELSREIGWLPEGLGPLSGPPSGPAPGPPSDEDRHVAFAKPGP
ncbi:MAG: IclR family transcriptional regulator [Solirubrobacterales bacterium]|nr:IclR family transcriptional regulator [Solirubrobacterales bacterium]